MPSKKPHMTRSTPRPRKPTRRERSSPKRSTYKAAEREVFGRNVRAARLAMGWNQTELGYRIVSDANYVRLVETGRVNVSIDRMAALACAFEQPLYKLLESSFTMSKSSDASPPTGITESREIATCKLPSSGGRIPGAMERRIFGENIRSARLAREWTQEEVARQLGFTVSTIPPTEAGRTNVSIDRMAAFANLFEMPLHRLLHN